MTNPQELERLAEVGRAAWDGEMGNCTCGDDEEELDHAGWLAAATAIHEAVTTPLVARNMELEKEIERLRGTAGLGLNGSQVEMLTKSFQAKMESAEARVAELEAALREISTQVVTVGYPTFHDEPTMGAIIARKALGGDKG